MRTVLILVLLAAFVAGCGDKPAQPEPGASPPVIASEETRKEKTGPFEAKTVVVSRAERFGKVNPGPLGALTEAQSLNIFSDAFGSAEKMEGIMDVDLPEYDVVFEAESGGRASYHLWLGQREESVGMYTTTENTGQGYRLTQEATKKLRSLIYALNYSPEQAEANGDVVDVHGSLSNSVRLKQFADNVKNGVADIVHVTRYSVEGDPIFQDVSYDGTSLRFTLDTTMDAFGSPSRAFTFCEGIAEKDGQYVLTGCDRDDIAFSVTLPGN
ncbi:DUF4362 domain-containing protein [Cohnella sp. GCM10027633]|uniref:DUF4362 domain-containing protein n=1 Tax=unclassified Cohnella TaxID=2636738 RepID=UPI0036293099